MQPRVNPLTAVLLSLSALCAGFCLYLFFRRNTYLHTFFQSVFGCTPPYFFVSGVFGAGIRSWLGDFLWSFALYFMLLALLQSLPFGTAVARVTPVLLGGLLEVLQFSGITAGTADVWDVVVEAAAVLCAELIVFFYQRSRWK